MTLSSSVLTCRHSSSSTNETRQLLQIARAGRVRTWLEKLRRQLSNVATRTQVIDGMQSRLTAVNADIHEVNRRVNELTFV